MDRSPSIALLLAAAAPALLMAGAVWAAGPAGLGFQGAVIGMSLADWRLLPLPPGAGPDAIKTCSDVERTARVPGYALSAEEVRTGVVACAYVARFGHTDLRHTVAIDPSFSASQLVYLFRRGRLAEIRFNASVDAYDDIRRVLGAQLGAPLRGARSSRPQTWRTAQGAVTIGPGPNATELSVRIAAR